ncbi:SDR family NAD(P)-dependent oxidoreductase [Aspergillus foveolatus]|uniref:SDR family NAD(P)-dependent oxidoreductase n=1 Tax=Aspergillus foveolatus TaxID=210207 RepID=UPI003CCE1FB0
MSSFNPQPTKNLAELNGKTVIVTGGARGIGAATVKVFNLHGANVVIADVSSSNEVAQKLIASLPYPEKALFYPVDILNWEQVLGLFCETKRRFGSIDTVVANAGIMEKTDTLDIESTDENGNLLESTGAFHVIDVNIKGTLNTLRLAIHYMKCSPDRPAGCKSIVLVASTSGYFGGTGVSAYVSSKHAIIGLLRSSHIAASKNGVTVTAVAPFFTYTNITAKAGARWQAGGLKPNTTEDVGMAIALSSVEGESGSCTLVAGPHRREMEASRSTVMPQWLGNEIHVFFQNAFRIISSSGGYNLPKGSKI